LIEYGESWVAGNMNNRKDMHKHFGGTNRANICGRYKGLNEILVLKLLR